MKKQFMNKSDQLTSFPGYIEYFITRFVDRFFEILPRPVPPKHLLKKCKIVSHRGIYDNMAIMENTLDAFDKVKSFGIWGVEIDLRWTKDLVPIVIHDSSLERLFGEPALVSQQSFSDIKSRFPMIPSLEEVVDLFGRDLHLMIEIKREHYPDPDYQNRVFDDVLRGLKPKENYHLLSLNPNMFDLISFVSPEVCLPIATKNIRAFSCLALNRGYGGINGHYVLVSDNMLLRHHQNNQKVGTGFVESVNCLFRELNRKVDWVFSNDAAKLQSQVNAMI